MSTVQAQHLDAGAARHSAQHVTPRSRTIIEPALDMHNIEDMGPGGQRLLDW
ncbi:MAG: hypothetical protein ACON3Z_05930 [Bradymonadia bacterium]